VNPIYDRITVMFRIGCSGDHVCGLYTGFLNQRLPHVFLRLRDIVLFPFVIKRRTYAQRSELVNLSYDPHYGYWVVMPLQYMVP